jgi:hypothetical protein
MSSLRTKKVPSMRKKVNLSSFRFLEGVLNDSVCLIEGESAPEQSSDASNLDIFDTSISVSFVCPVSRRRIQVPIKGALCVHAECIDSRVSCRAEKRSQAELI